MTAPTYVLPSPPDGYVGSPASDRAAQDARFFGEDIWFSLATATEDVEPDYVITAAGDFAVAGGLEALRQSLLRRLITNPGDWQTLPDFGVGALQYVKALNTASNRAELEAKIRSQFLADPRVESVTEVQISDLGDVGTGLKIVVFVVAAGRLRTDLPLPVSIVLK